MFKSANSYRSPHTVFYFENIDALRFVLSLFVLIFHIPVISNSLGLPSDGKYAFLQKGFLAVNWFFVLSGFLLAHLAKREVVAGSFSIRKFITRRILRIWPVYFIVTVIGITVYYFLLPVLHILFENKTDLSTATLLSVFFLSNILHTLYDPGGILTITWSVSIEEQFYLLFPLAVVVFFKEKKTRVSAMIFFLILITGIHLIWPSPAKSLEYFNIYFELFIIGILASELLSFFGQMHAGIKKLMLVITIIIFLLSFFTPLFDFDDHVFTRVVNGLLSAFVILTLCTTEKSIRSRIFNMGGKISYGIYMYHMIIITGVVFITKTFFLRWRGKILA